MVDVETNDLYPTTCFIKDTFRYPFTLIFHRVNFGITPRDYRKDRGSSLGLQCQETGSVYCVFRLNYGQTNPCLSLS